MPLDSQTSKRFLLTMSDCESAVESSAKYRSSWFTKENAKEMANRAVAKRRELELERERNPEPEPPPTDSLTQFITDQVARVRAHLLRVDERLAKAKRPQDIEKLARSRGLLAEQERIARGQPLPGAYRPDKSKPAPRSAVEPV